MNDLPIRGDILNVCQRLHQRNLIAAADGNVSCRLSPDRLVITPSGKNKAFLRAEDLAEISLSGEILSGTPSSEMAMHLMVYQHCPEAKAVVHAHPPTAIAWSVAFPSLTTLPSEHLSEVILAMGEVPIVPYQRPGTDALAQSLVPLVPQHRALVLSRHGALCWGESLVEAYNGMERLEHSAQILMSAATLKGLNPQNLTPLSPEEVRWLREKRAALGKTLL